MHISFLFILFALGSSKHISLIFIFLALGSSKHIYFLFILLALGSSMHISLLFIFLALGSSMHIFLLFILFALGSSKHIYFLFIFLALDSSKHIFLLFIFPDPVLFILSVKWICELGQVFFMLYSNYSAMTLFESTFLFCFNTLYTSGKHCSSPAVLFEYITIQIYV